MAPTPVVYFGAYHLRAGSCVSVTGSHNPPDYNGFKIVVGGETLSGDAITDLYDRIAEGRLYTADTPGSVRIRTFREDYVQRIANDVQIDRPLRGRGRRRQWRGRRHRPARARPRSAPKSPRCTARSTAPSRTTTPTRANRTTSSDLIRMVQRLDADLGIAFDGDGDRLGVVTRDGQNIFPDRLLMLFAAGRARPQPGRADHLRREVHRAPAGPHPAPRRQPADVEDGPFADQGQDARNRRRAGRRDERPLLLQGALVRLRRRHLRRRAPARDPRQRSRSRPARRWRRCPTACPRRRSRSMRPTATRTASSRRFRNAAQFEGARLSTIDGLRVDFPDGWGLVRASNTTPVLVMRFDADEPRRWSASRPRSAAVAGAQAGSGAAVLSQAKNRRPEWRPFAAFGSERRSRTRLRCRHRAPAMRALQRPVGLQRGVRARRRSRCGPAAAAQAGACCRISSRMLAADVVGQRPVSPACRPVRPRRPGAAGSSGSGAGRRCRAARP